ncbi:hypothetical protein [Massilia sp. TWR1-2-2]|uniref:hypothetical protein n=1 Tax=Massilia sp. TWR1-2-2 TaxID=2804584 RepID=UPI003CF6C53D
MLVLKNSNLRFDHVTYLARFLAQRISEIEGTTLVSTTLLRNPRYRVLLQHSYDLELKTGAKGEAPRSSKIGNPVETRQLQIENSNLKQENTRLKARLTELGSSGALGANAVALSHEAMRPFEHDFIQTCQSLEKVMEALGDYVAVDSGGSIVDSSKRVNNLIVEPWLVAPFLKWRKTRGGT